MMIEEPDENTEESVTEDAPRPPQLTAIELRVLGVLMEKQLTTPDQYPLTVNGIITGSNQKSSRDPVTSYEQGEITRALRALEDKHFVRREYGSRADKYSQHFMHHLELGKKHQAVLCLMMLRGPQTLSELSTRTLRMDLFSDKEELLHCVERLCDRALPCVIRLGYQRGERFGHLFSGIPEVQLAPAPGSHSAKSSGLTSDDRDTLSLLESEVSDLSESVRELKNENRELKQQLDRLYEMTGHSLPVSND